MLKKIYINEFIYWLKRPSVYIYGMVFFGFAFIGIIGTGGFFDPPTMDKNVRLVNAPFELNYMIQYFNKFLLFLVPSIIGASIYKDFKYRMHSIVYTFPIKKSSYLLGRFLSSFTIVALLTLSVGLAFLIGEHMPGLDENKIGPFQWKGYLQIYLVYIFPNMLFFGAIVFAVVSWTRSIYTGFIAIVILFFLQIIIENALGGSSSHYLLALLDPFAQNTTQYITQNWTLDDQKTRLIPLDSVLIFNRLIWLGISGLIFYFAYSNFSFSEHGARSFFRNRKGKRSTKENFSKVKSIALTKSDYDYSFVQRLKTMWKLSGIDLRFIVKNWTFYLFLFFGLIAVVFALARVTNLEDMTILPVTRLMLFIPALFFSIIIMLMTFLYSGMLVHQPQRTRMYQLTDTTPTPNWVFLLSKVIAIIKMQVVLLFVMMAAGMIIQTINGYFNYEIGLYLFHLFVVMLTPLIVWSFVSVFIQTLIPNTYVGLFVLLMGWFGVSGLGEVGLNTKLVLFNLPPTIFYTDQNGYAELLAPYFLIESYWLVFAAMFLILASLLWIRGVPEGWKDRFSLAKKRWSKSVSFGLGFLILCFVFLGFSIYQAEKEDQKVNAFFEESRAGYSEFKKKNGHLVKVIQPRITAVDLDLDLFPERNSFKAEGTYTLVNKSNEVIDTVLVKTGFDEYTDLDFNVGNKVLLVDTMMRFSVFKLEKILQPLDTFQIDFTIENRKNTLFEKNSNVLKNGTFLKHDFLPQIGYVFNTDTQSPMDSSALLNHRYALNSDMVDFKTVVSTSSDQIAVAPGYLKKEWVEKDRRYFQYEMDQPMKFQFGFNTARFEVYKENWKDISLEVYYQKGHDFNIPQMMDGLKSALEYNTKYFSPYQHREARIIEFPHSEGTYATTMANSIPMSEIRFINNADTTNRNIDLSFYVPAHELTHQWWGNQLAPADAQGAIMLTESITEYVTLRIYENFYGKAHADNFLKHQRGRYLKGRTREKGEETSLVMVKSHQDYIAYGKGTMAFNAMSHYLGEKSLNQILKEFLETYKFKAAPYPSSIELLDRLKQATPDSLQYVIEDYFETVTFYSNKINAATISQIADSAYELKLDFSISKQRKKDTSLPLQDYIEIGFFDKNEKLLEVRKLKVSQEKNTVVFDLKYKPAKVVIDPNLLMLDKNIDDNESDL